MLIQYLIENMHQDINNPTEEVERYEINTYEIIDPTHLSSEEQDHIRSMAEAIIAGTDEVVENCPITRGYVNGYIMQTNGQRLSESGYDSVLTLAEEVQLLFDLQKRFERNMERHENIKWSDVLVRLKSADPEKLWALNEMEKTGGEPDVRKYIKKTGEFEFWEFATNIPDERANLYYNREDEMGRPDSEDSSGNAVDLAEAMGLDGFLDLMKYKELQEMGEFDTTSFCFIQAPHKAVTRSKKAYQAWRDSTGYHVEDYPFFSSDAPKAAFRGWKRI